MTEIERMVCKLADELPIIPENGEYLRGKLKQFAADVVGLVLPEIEIELPIMTGDLTIGGMQIIADQNQLIRVRNGCKQRLIDKARQAGIKVKEGND